MHVYRLFGFRDRCAFGSFAMFVCASSMMVGASFVPWLRDPLGQDYSAWDIPVRMGWGIYSRFVNYGSLCCGCAVCLFFLACMGSTMQNRLPRVVRPLPAFFSHGNRFKVCLLCLFPGILIFLQYLVYDMQGINQLAQHEIQSLLIKQHLGYNVALPLFPIHPLKLDTSQFTDRLVLFIDQLSFGPLLPCLCAGLLFCNRGVWQMLKKANESSAENIHVPRKIRWLLPVLWAFVGIGLLCLFGRMPVAAWCEYQVHTALAVGDYAQASTWLDRALFFNPEMAEYPMYHIQRGQIRYFLLRDDQCDDCRVFFASAAIQQAHYQNAYQQLFLAWSSQSHTPWLLDELCLALERFSESKHVLVKVTGKSEIAILQEDEDALPLLQRLIQLDPSNLYANYVLGRIDCDFHAYIDCSVHMQRVIQFSTNQDIQSSAYTYIGLSEAGQGHSLASRKFFLKAIALDPNYFNNTAREELSGLR